MTEETPDMFPETLPVEVPVTGNAHKHNIGEFYGMMKALEALDAVPETKRVAGFNYAMAILQREVADLKSDIMGQNMRAVARAGHDINTFQNIALKGQLLICTPYPPGEEM